MSKTTVQAGICGFTATMHTSTDDDEMVCVKFETTCPNFKKLEKETLSFDPYECCFAKIGQGEIYDMFRPLCPHITCPIPTAFLKAVEWEAGLALPKDVSITFEK